MEDHMLIRFTAKNHLSIASEQELSLVSSTLKGPTAGIISAPETVDVDLLPAAIIYGANASGKTNYLKSIEFFKRVILGSHVHGDPQGGVPRKKYALDQEIGSSSSLFEADFIVDGTRHQYGFECDDDIFITEWLYAFPEGKRRKIYVRNKQEVVFGPSFKGPKKAIAELMRNNSLFLSTATQNDHSYLSSIVNFFRKAHIITSIETASTMVAAAFKQDEIDKRSIEFLKLVGTGIVGYKKNTKKLTERNIQFSKKIFDLIKTEFGEDVRMDEQNADTDVEISLLHTGKNGTECPFSIQRESAGTRRLLLLLDRVFSALDNGTLLLIDEIDASLHTLAAEQIIQLFCDPSINKNGAQIIVTTHDTNLLKSKFLRRDQIWFCEKDIEGSSHLFALSEFRMRQNNNFESDYLDGRYGAIPFSGNINNFVAKLSS